MTNVDATTLAATAAANASKGWIETADDGFVSMNEGEINEAIQDYLRETYRQKAISRRILTAATKNQMEEAGDDDFGFGVFSDWRGRKYYHACGLSPQGKDMGKGLLMAATPRMLGKHGLRHLKRGVANTWGNGIEKATMAKREAWADEVIASGWLRTVVEGAQAQEDFTWRLADEPLQFLALAADLLAALDSGNPETYFSSVLIGYDATCSGLQILAALTRCASTARLVNVLPREDGERADIYLTLADKCREVCVELVNGMDSAAAAARIGDNTAQGDDWAVFWQDKITRSVTKKPCMVYCYGGKKRTFAGAIREETKAPWKACMWLAALMYDTVLPALLPKAHAFMELLQEVARLLAQQGKPVEFVTANGLPFVQAVEEEESKRVNAEITRGRVQLIITKTTGKLDSRKQMSGVAPNVVHHFDALFLENAVLAFEEAGIDCFATVHDCFYMRAGDWGDETTGGWSILRREFRDTFKGDVVADLWAKLGAASGVEMPEVPEAGDLDLNAVLRSDFLFS